VRGGADVDLNEDVLLHLLQALRNQGIRKIKGDVILDRQLFQPARPNWASHRSTNSRGPITT
jgi:D-alanyl-D-alanine carboxypeptidase/D-alanyl-D-alanine-endopeptidase (penicillin-binding protein 4)